MKVLDSPLAFTARVISGAGRGRQLGTPTINLNLDDVPTDLLEGVSACTVRFSDDREMIGALYYGPRPVFGDSVACEVHIIDKDIEDAPDDLEITVTAHMREVMDFPSPEDLKKQMQKDISEVRSFFAA